MKTCIMSESPESADSPNDICSICLNPFDETNVCETQCHHRFCKSCLDEWFNKHQLTCPLCRTPIQYFNYQGYANRVVCIYGRRTTVQPPPTANPGPFYMITKRTMIVMNAFGLFSISSLVLSLGYWIQCHGCGNCDMLP